MLNQSIVCRIYETVYKRIKRTEIDLFLCGGASTAKHKSTRDSLREQIQKLKNLAIYYPEDLFSEILARKKTDLLTLENYLADNSDVIMIICESCGSFTEFGAFVSNKEICGKVVAFIQSKYKNDKSFINQGPVEYLKKHSDRNTTVKYYNTDITSIKSGANDVLTETAKLLRKTNSRYDLTRISGQVCFIMLLLFFFDTIKYDDLRKAVREKWIAENVDGTGAENDLQFEVLYIAAIKRLYYKGFLVKRVDLGRYQLSLNGYLKVNSYLRGIDFYKKDNWKDTKMDNMMIMKKNELPDSVIRNKKTIRDRYAHVDSIRLDVLRESFYRHGCS